MNGELESLMRDVGRVVEGEARRQNMLPQIQARLAARQSLRARPARAAVRWGFALGRAWPPARRPPSSICIRARSPTPSRGWARGRSAPRWSLRLRPARAPVLRRIGGHAAAPRHRPRRRARARRRDRGDRRRDARGLGHPPRAHPLAGAGGRLPDPGDRHPLRRRLGSGQPGAHRDDARGLGPGQRSRAQRARSGGDRPAPARQRQRRRSGSRERSGAQRRGRADAHAGSARRAGHAWPGACAGAAPHGDRARRRSARRRRAPRRVEAVAAHAGTPTGGDWRDPGGARASTARRWRPPCSKGGAPSARGSAPTTWSCSATWRAWRAIPIAPRRPIVRRAGGSPMPTGRSTRSGLIAFEGRHNYKMAGDLFASYLRSFPRGPLAREAAGRLIESRLKAGDDAEARQRRDRLPA